MFLKEKQKNEFSGSIQFFLIVFKLMDQGELSNFIWNAIPNFKTGVVKAFFDLF